MSNGYVLAAEADLALAHEIGDGFGLDVIDASTIGDVEAVSAALATAANVGVVISLAAAADDAFVALLRLLGARLGVAQLIIAEADAPQAFTFLPQSWPAMTLDEARGRAERRREMENAPRAAPLPPQRHEEAPPPPADARDDRRDLAASAEPPQDAPEPDAPLADDDDGASAPEAGAEPEPEAAPPPRGEAAPPPAQAAPPAAIEAPPPEAPAPEQEAAPLPQAPGGSPHQDEEEQAAAPRKRNATPARRDEHSAKADATAFAPKKLRRDTPELVRIVIHQPQQLRDVIKAARKIDPRAEPAPQGMGIGDVAFGAKVGVALDVRGASCDGELQRRTWTGEPIDFSFPVEAEDGAKQAVFLARVFVDDAQIGVLAFARKISGPAKKAAAPGDVRMKRHKRVFLSYSSKDRETVSAIATAYQMAGVEFFWDRTSLKSGEEWSPRLRKEIDRADLFHLCWSKSAAASEWVDKETTHALRRRRSSGGKRPEITVQMLDGPPWAPHPPHLESINFDDFVRAAIVGYARGDGGEESASEP